MADESLRTTIAQRIDLLCQQFEAAWQRGEPASIDEFIQRADPNDRQVLLRELSQLEKLYRQRERGNKDSQDATVTPEQSAAKFDRGGEQEDCPYQNRGRYSVLRAVAHGGMGKVSVARDEALKRDVALKELLDGVADFPASQQRFVAEAEITGQLEHPGIVPIYALGADSRGKPFYAMRFVQGQTLREAIEEYHTSRRPAELKSLLRRFVLVCQTMAYAHDRGVIHRDLKPANIMLGPFGETLVLDWGLAKPIDDGKADGSTLGAVAYQQLAGRPDLTGADAVVGTPAYMPPEQARGKVALLGAATDIYSLGAVLYHLLTGVPPYSGSSSVEVLEKVRNSSPGKPSTVCCGVPPALEAICLKAMARRPKARYGSATELAESIERWLDDESVDAYREPLLARLYRWSRKHKAAVTSGAISLVCILLVGSVATVLYQRERDKARVFERIAADYGRRAADAEQQAKDKEVEADRLAQEAAESRRQASDAAQKRAEAQQAAEQAKKQIAELETALAAKTGESADLTKKIDAAREELASAEAQTEAESKRADEAVDRAAELERQVVALRREADQYREITLRLTRLADLAANQQEAPAVEANTPWNDLTQRDPASFDITATNGSAGSVTADTTRVRTGRQSLRVSSDNSGGVCLTYPKSRNAGWDLSKYDYLTFAFSLADQKVRYRGNGLAVRIGRGSQCIEYHAKPEALSLTPKGWAFVKLPLWGNSVWTKKEINPLNLSHVDWLELSISTWSPKITLWLEDVKFGADPRHVDRELIPDPDRAAAEYVVAAKGETQVWASGKTVTIRTPADIPAEPFKVVFVFVGGNAVTDAGLKLFGRMTDCQTLRLADASTTEDGLEHLKDMPSLRTLNLIGAWATGSGLRHFVNHQTLNTLELNATSSNDAAMVHVAGIPNLAFLEIGNTRVTDDAMVHVASLSKLNYLSIAGTQISDEGLARLSTHPSLCHLNMQACPRISEEGLRRLKDLPAGLQWLALDTAAAPHGLGFFEGHPLGSLTLGALPTRGRIEEVFLESLKLFPQLRYVSLNRAIVNANVLKRLSELEALRYLYLKCPATKTFGDSLKNMAAASELEVLEIEGAPISIEGAPISIESAPISDANLQELAALRKLKTLVLRNVAVPPAAVLKLQASLPTCKITVDSEIQRAMDELRASQ